METSEQPIFPSFEAELQCSQQVSPASQPPLPGSEEARTMTAGSGRQCSMLLDVSSPLGVFSKTLLESLHWTNSEEYCYVWNRLDTKFGCSAFQLTAPEQSTEDNGCSLLPTATAGDANSSGSRNTPESRAHAGVSLTDWARGDQGTGRSKLWRTPNTFDSLECGHQMNLGDQAKAPELWPTPAGVEARVTPEWWLERQAYWREKGQDLQMPLSIAAKLWPTPRKEGYDSQGAGHGDLQYEVKNRLWPTPTQRDWKSTSHGNQNNARPLSEVAGLMAKSGLEITPPGSSLNPEFVEWLQGFPIGWTELK